MLTKVCKSCGKEKPLNAFSKSSTNRLGCCNYCKDCKNWAHRSEKSKQEELERIELSSKGLKRCSICKEIKPTNEFPPRKTSPDGLHGYCRVCLRQVSREFARKPEQKAKKKERESKPEFLEHLSNYRKNSSKYKETLINYRETSTVFKDYQQEYRKRLYVKIRRDHSTRIWAELKLYGQTKKSSYDEYLGCSYEFYFDYISAQFREGMTWENWGRGSDKWHIDHIIPCAMFDMNNEEDVKKCFHYSNQQPLWETENLRKNSKNAEGKRIFKRYKK